MRKKYLSALLFGALLFASAGTFTSCKDYDDDIDNLQSQISANASAIEALKKVVENGDYVTGVEKSATGLTITFKNAGAKTITLEDKVGSIVTVENGVLCIDGKATEIKVAEPTEPTEHPKDQIIIENGMWSVLQEDGTYKSTGIPVSGVTVTGSEAAGYVLTIINADGTQIVKLPTASSTITSIAIIAVRDDAKTFNAIENTAASESVIQWYKSGEVDWAGPKGKVVKDQLLVGQIETLVGVISVTPASVDLGAQELALVDSKGNVAPVTVKAIANSDKLETAPRAASANGKWNLQITPAAELTADNIAKAFGEWSGATYNAKLYALQVNGTVMTPYDLAIKTAASAATDLTTAPVLKHGPSGPSAWNRLTVELSTNKSGVTPTINSSTTATISNMPIGTTTISCKDAALYDAYISFEGTEKAKAGEWGVTANGLTITAAATAKDKTGLKGTLHMLAINGQTSTATITFSFAGTSIETPEAIATTEYKVVKKDASNLKELVINLGDVFSSMSDAQTEAIDAFSQFTVTNIKDQTKFLLADGNFAANVTYHKDKDGAIGDQITNLSAADARDLRWMKIALPQSSINANAEAGSYKLVLTIKNATSTTELKKVEIPVNVTLPTFDELFTTTNKWSDGAFNVTLTNFTTTQKPAINFTQAFNAGTGVATTGITYTIDKVNDKAIKQDESNGTVALQNILNDKSELAVKTLQVQGSYTIAGKLTVKSEKFTTNMKSIFEGAALKFFVDGVAQDEAVVADNNKIAAYTPAVGDVKAAGLAVVKGSGAAKMTSSATLDGLTLNHQTTSAVGTVAFAQPTVEGLSTVTATASGGTITLTDIQSGDYGVLSVVFTDYTGIKTTLKINFKK